MSRHTRHARRCMAVAVCAVVASACGISPDDSPRDIDQRVATPLVEPPAVVEAIGAERIYLVAPDVPGLPDRLQAVARDTGDVPLAVVEAVLAGPSADELDSGYRSILPPTVRVNSVTVRRSGVLAVDLSSEIRDVAGDVLPLGLAQLVYSVDLLPGVSAMLVTVDGQMAQWPAGNGELVSGPLTVYDYPALVQSAQPPYPAIPTPAD
jgi:hypothetical protein